MASVSPGKTIVCAAAAALSCFLIPITASAQGSTCIPGIAVCIGNTGGTATGTSTAGLSMIGSGGSIASTVNNINGTLGTNLGSLTLTTGSLKSGSLSAGGFFNTGTLTITTTGYNGFTGTLFSGTFGDPNSGIQWLFLGKVGTQFQYELIGPISGTWEGGSVVSGETAQLYFHSSTLYNGGSIALANGSTAIVVPEPGAVGLMGTGLLGMGLLVRRRVKRQSGDSV